MVPIVTRKLDNQTNKEWEALLNIHLTNSKDEIPTLDRLLEFLTDKQETLENISQNKSNDVNKHANQLEKRTHVHTFTTNTVSCTNCNKCHFIQNCEEFLKLSATDRCKKAKELKLCLNCLRKGHFLQNCQSKSLCKICKKHHHTTLHLSRTANTFETNACDPNTKSNNSSNTEVVMNCTATQANCQVLLSTAKYTHLIHKILNMTSEFYLIQPRNLILLLKIHAVYST